MRKIIVLFLPFTFACSLMSNGKEEFHNLDDLAAAIINKIENNKVDEMISFLAKEEDFQDENHQLRKEYQGLTKELVNQIKAGYSKNSKLILEESEEACKILKIKNNKVSLTYKIVSADVDKLQPLAIELGKMEITLKNKNRHCKLRFSVIKTFNGWHILEHFDALEY